MSLPTTKTADDFTFKHSGQPDEYGASVGDYTTVQDNFDSRAIFNQTQINAIIMALQSVTDNDSGADNIGMTPTPETGSANKIQTIIEALIARLKATTDSSSGLDLIGGTAITDLDGTTGQALLESIRNKLKSVTDGSSGADFIGATALYSGGASTIQAIVEYLYNRVNASQPTLGIYSVKDYGAKCDGTTNDTAKIQDTINAASVNGGTVLYPTGTYKIDSDIFIANGANVYFVFAENAKLSGSGTISGKIKNTEIHPEWWGAKGDGTTDDYTAIASAIAYSKASGIKDVVFRPAKYKCGTALTTNKNVCLKGNNTEIDFDGVAGVCLEVKSDHNNDLLYANAVPVVVDGIDFVGDGSYDSVNVDMDFTTDQNAIKISTFRVKFENVGFYGFDKNFVFGNSVWSIFFEYCRISNANYGVYFTKGTSSGANIVFNNCALYENNYHAYNSYGELYFNNCSFDACYYGHIKDNLTFESAYNQGGIFFSSCHFETYNQYAKETRFVNNGIMRFVNGVIYDDSTDIFDNVRITSIDGTSFHVPTGYLAERAGDCFIVEKPGEITSSTFIMLHASLSNVINGDFETGDITGWTSTNAATTVAQTTKKKNGTYALAISRKDGSNGATLTSGKVPCAGHQTLAISFYYNTYGCGGTMYNRIEWYDYKGTYMNYTALNIAQSVSDAWAYKGQMIKIPKGAASFDIYLDGNTSVSSPAYYDDFYVNFDI